MKKILSFVLLMMMIVIVLPLLIIKGCSFRKYDSPTGEKDGIRIKVYITSEKKVQEMLLEEYIKNVVAGEMPAEFELEALKAQAVAARTYAFVRIKKDHSASGDVHEGADICTDPAHCQAWASKESAMKRWGFLKGYKYWSKIERAVRETESVVITYNHTVIADPVFHSNSGGRTENAKDVWSGNEAPYLRSVKSEGEDVSSEFKNTVIMETKEFINKFKAEYPQLKINEKDVLKDIKIIDYTEGERVKNIRVGNVNLKGTDVRRILSLKSANFKIEKGEKNTLKITTQGYGHGVGMSQWGANYLAKGGGSYEEILKYYYQGIELEKIENLKD